MSTKLTIECRKGMYGDTFYPVCKPSQIFAAIAKTKSLTNATILLLEMAGFEFEIVEDTRPQDDQYVAGQSKPEVES